MKVGVVTVNREAEEPVPSRRRIAGTTTIRGAYPEKAREVGAGDVVLKGAIPGVPPSWSTYGDPRARSDDRKMFRKSLKPGTILDEARVHDRFDFGMRQHEREG